MFGVIGDDRQAVIEGGCGDQCIRQADTKARASQVAKDIGRGFPDSIIDGEHGEGGKVSGGLCRGIKAGGKFHSRDPRDIGGSTVMPRKKRHGTVTGDALVLPRESDEKIGVVDHYEISGRGRRLSA